MLCQQLGVTGSAPIGSINEHWEYPENRFSFTISKVNEIKYPFVAEAICDDQKILDITPSFLMRADVHVEWNDIPAVFMQQHAAMLESSKNHRNAMLRTQKIALAYINNKKNNSDFANDIIVTLDGCGNNRCAFQKTFADLLIPCPRIVTLECDAIVALSQRLVYGEDVIFTAGDPLIRSTKIGNGRQKVLLEHCVLHDRLASDRVAVVYLDYCGGPPAGMKMQCVLAKFPNLQVYAATMSRRQHCDVEKRFNTYIPCLYDFYEAAVFLDNPRVVCKMYVSNQGKRRVQLPGYFWENCPNKLKRKKFEGVMVEDNTAAVTTERGVELIYLNKEARATYLR